MRNGRYCDDKAGCLRKSYASAPISYPHNRVSPKSYVTSAMVDQGTYEEKSAIPSFDGRYEETYGKSCSRLDTKTIATK